MVEAPLIQGLVTGTVNGAAVPGCEVGTLMTWLRSLNSVDGREPSKGLERGGTWVWQNPQEGLHNVEFWGLQLVLAVVPQAARQMPRVQVLSWELLEASEVCSEAQTLYRFHINTFHCLLSFH